MAAKLEWKGSNLVMGAFIVGGVECAGFRKCRYWAGYALVISASYELHADCMHDCESEVRRLLKEAGVEVEP